MLINKWYVAAHSHEVTTEPVRVRMLGQDVVLFRDTEGKAHCLHDTCVHRGGSLCRGQVVEGTIECPYHGWRFAGDGKCVLIPSLGPETKPPKRARVDSYPVVEKYDFIWAFFGDLPEAERPPLPDFFPEYENNDGSWRFIRDTFVFNCNWVRALENGVDATHASFVHTDFGTPEDPKRDPYEVRVTEHNLYSSGSGKAPKKRGLWKEVVPEDRKTNFTEVQIQTSAPSIRIQMHLFADKSQIIVTGYTPIDENHTRLHFIHSRNFVTDPKHDDDTRRRMFTVLQEDADVLNYVRPISIPPLLSDELLLANDTHGVAFRKWFKSREAAGELIDSAAWAQETDRIKTVPSPGRRDDPKNWVYGTVPMKPKRADEPTSEAAE